MANRKAEHPERVTAIVDTETGNTLRNFAQDYGAQISAVVNDALQLYFELSGYTSSGYDLQAQHEKIKSLSPLTEQHLITPPGTVTTAAVFRALTNGAFDDSPTAKQYAQTGDTEKARAAYLGNK